MIHFKHSCFFFSWNKLILLLKQRHRTLLCEENYPQNCIYRNWISIKLHFSSNFCTKNKAFFCVLDDMKKMIWCLFCLNPIYKISFFNKNWSKDNSYKFNKKKVLFLMRIRSLKFPRQFMLTNSKKHLILNITFVIKRIIYRWLKKKGNSLSPQKFGTTFFI